MPASVEELLKILLERSSKCFCCKWIYEDLKANGKLTGYPKDFLGSGTWPVEGKLRHLELEGILCPQELK